MKQVVDLRARVWFYFYLLLRVWFYEHFERCLNARRRKEGERGNHVNSYFCLFSHCYFNFTLLDNGGDSVVTADREAASEPK